MSGLDWSAVGARLADIALDEARRARVSDLLAEIEAGALKAAADRRADEGDG